MYPFCLASMGLIVVSATSAGGMTVLAVKLSQRKNKGKEVSSNLSERNTRGQHRRIGLAGIGSEQPMPANKAQVHIGSSLRPARNEWSLHAAQHGDA